MPADTARLPQELTAVLFVTDVPAGDGLVNQFTMPNTLSQKMAKPTSISQFICRNESVFFAIEILGIKPDPETFSLIFSVLSALKRSMKS